MKHNGVIFYWNTPTSKKKKKNFAQCLSFVNDNALVLRPKRFFLILIKIIPTNCLPRCKKPKLDEFFYDMQVYVKR